MANVIIIAGETGTGKTRSVKNLNPKETYIINVLNKPLSFKGSNSLYNEEQRNMKSVGDYQHVLTLMQSVNTKALHVKNLIIDDCGFIMQNEYFARAKEAGYGKFSEFGQHMQLIISEAGKMRNDLNIVFVFHADDVEDEGIKVGKQIKLIGKMLSDKYDPMATVSVVLFTDVSTTKEGTKYQFITNRCTVGKQVIPAKSPEEMFDSLYIENDLNYVFNKIKEYYN
jgi:hypothetical protein